MRTGSGRVEPVAGRGRLGSTTYDALYVLLARDFDAELVTADERLHTAVTGVPIRLLGP